MKGYPLQLIRLQTMALAIRQGIEPQFATVTALDGERMDPIVIQGTNIDPCRQYKLAGASLLGLLQRLL